VLENNSQTICAISTPAGVGGIGIVRMSGSDAIDISKRIFVQVSDNGRDPLKGHSIQYGKIKDPGTGLFVDEVLLTTMLAPKTYTREDVVEINCHSGPVILGKILMILTSLGARIAEPGEFTKRAFLNGRIDLAQAEAVISLISAKTEAAMRTAMHQLSGELSRRIHRVRSRLVHLLSEVEASIDFSEEGLDLAGYGEIQGEVSEIIDELDRLIDSSEKGKILTEGVLTAIVGKANVGKSSLLNRLLLEDRAIVTPFPGTTRDIVEAALNIEGVPFRMLDTAGIRDPQDPVEKEGVKRSRESIEQADIVIMMVDLSDGPDREDVQVAQMLRNKKTVLVLNKVDLVKKDEKDGYSEIFDIIRPKIAIKTSVVNDIGINDLKKEVVRFVLEGKEGFSEQEIITNIRHVRSLVSVKEALQRVLEGVRQELFEEFLSVDLRSALTELGRITGETTTDDILDEIFRCFCVGK
jgi:tRNA modification GTPase